jgi:hypothetical protein
MAMKNVYHLAFYYRKLRYFPLIGLFLAILAIPPDVNAEMYKWVDEAGTVHYSQSPPSAGIESTIITPPPAVDTAAAQASLENRLENLERTLQEREESVLKSRETELERAEQARLCQQARARLASYERPRVSVPTADGGQRRPDEEEREEELQPSNELINDLCR